jgi:hypothetical protein
MFLSCYVIQSYLPNVTYILATHIPKINIVHSGVGRYYIFNTHEKTGSVILCLS